MCKPGFVIPTHIPPSLVKAELCLFPASFTVLLTLAFDIRNASLNFLHLLVLCIVVLLCSTLLHFGLRGNVRWGPRIAIKSKLQIHL